MPPDDVERPHGDQPDDPPSAATVKDEALREAARLEVKAEQIEALGQRMVRSARMVRDIVPPTRDGLSVLAAEALPRQHWADQRQVYRLGVGQPTRSCKAAN
jgi:hypothetical protein